MSSPGGQSSLNLPTTAHHNLSDQEQNVKLSDSDDNFDDDSDSSDIDIDIPESDKLWGEIEEVHDKLSGSSGLHSSIVREALKPTVKIEVPQDPITEHTVQLNKFARETECLIEEASSIFQNAQEGIFVDSSKLLKPIDFPPFPINFPLTTKLKDKIVELYSENPDITPPALSAAVFTKNTFKKPKIDMKAREIPLLTEESHKKLLVRCIAFFLQYVGYESVESEALHTLVSLMDVRFKNVLTRLKENVDSKIFPDDQRNLLFALEKTFKETGFEGIKEVLNSYQDGFIFKHQAVLENCIELHKTFYSKLESLEKLQNQDIGETSGFQAHTPQEDYSSDSSS